MYGMDTSQWVHIPVDSHLTACSCFWFTLFMLTDSAQRLFPQTSENDFKAPSQKLQRQSKDIDVQTTLRHMSGFFKRRLK